MTGVTNILMAGVGGQGIVLASDLVAEAALLAGYDVKKSEVHGMSQRGGAVDSHVRFGDKVHSPVIPKGEADVVFSLETLEVIRFADHASARAAAVYLDERILPGGLDAYPEGVDEVISRRFGRVLRVRKAVLKERIGDRHAYNVAVVGVLSCLVAIPKEAFAHAIAHRVPRGTEPLNLMAFEVGRNLFEAHRGLAIPS
jgi:indolepyruvate ferredoxin oxidoreductase, beta subunit